jgi:hypothetical protein
MTLVTSVVWLKLVYMVVKSKVWSPVVAMWDVCVRTKRAYSDTLSKIQKHRHPVSCWRKWSLSRRELKTCLRAETRALLRK